MTAIPPPSSGLGRLLLRPDYRWLDGIARRLAGLHTALRDSSHPWHVYQASTDRGFDGAGNAQSVDVAEETAFSIEEAYREHAVAMYRMAVTVVRDHAFAEDVVQESIVRAWRYLDTFRGEASLRTWLLRITHNTSVSMLRRVRDTPFDPQQMPDMPVPGPEGEAIGDEFVDAFKAALFELDETSRVAMSLRELEGLAYADIAEILGVPLPTVKTRIYRARRRLAEDLAPWRSS